MIVLHEGKRIISKWGGEAKCTTVGLSAKFKSEVYQALFQLMGFIKQLLSKSEAFRPFLVNLHTTEMWFFSPLVIEGFEGLHWKKLAFINFILYLPWTPKQLSLSLAQNRATVFLPNDSCWTDLEQLWITLHKFLNSSEENQCINMISLCCIRHCFQSG